MEENLNTFLEHYGVKGMKWGIRKEYEPTGKKTDKEEQSTDLTSEEISVLKKVFPNGADVKLMQQKYGPPGSASRKIELTEGQKTALKKVGIALVVGGALYYASNKLAYAHLPPETRTFFKDQTKFLMKRKISDYDDIVDVDLPVGAILKRVSMTAETQVRENGFYAAFDTKDVNRYKAALPVFWKMWGYPQQEGHVVNIKANKGVKAASPKTAFELYQSWRESDPLVARRWGSDDKSFFQFAHQWAAHADVVDGDTKLYFQHMIGRGYNAVVDVNDAGGLAERPLRMLSGEGFSVVKNDVLSAVDISSARATLQRIKHFLFGAYMENDHNDFLEHFGVKGMKWGVRREQRRQANQRVQETKQLVKEAKTLAKQARADRNQMRKDSAKRLAPGVAATIAVGAGVATAIAVKNSNTKVSSVRPPKWNFSASGDNFKIQAQDGRVFDMLTKLYAEQQRRG